MDRPVKHISISGIEVYIAPVEAYEDARGRRDAELRAVSMLAALVLPDGVEITHRDDGSPVAAGSGFEISVSHSRHYAVLAVSASGVRFGVDIEEWRPTLERVSGRFLTPEESEAWHGPDNLLRAWTLKEALYKAAGLAGIDFASDVSIPLPPSDRGEATVCGRRFMVVSCRLFPSVELSVAIPV